MRIVFELSPFFMRISPLLTHMNLNFFYLPVTLACPNRIRRSFVSLSLTYTLISLDQALWIIFAVSLEVLLLRIRFLFISVILSLATMILFLGLVIHILFASTTLLSVFVFNSICLMISEQFSFVVWGIPVLSM